MHIIPVILITRIKFQSSMRVAVMVSSLHWNIIYSDAERADSTSTFVTFTAEEIADVLKVYDAVKKKHIDNKSVWTDLTVSQKTKSLLLRKGGFTDLETWTISRWNKRRSVNFAKRGRKVDTDFEAEIWGETDTVPDKENLHQTSGEVSESTEPAEDIFKENTFDTAPVNVRKYAPQPTEPRERSSRLMKPIDRLNLTAEEVSIQAHEIDNPHVWSMMSVTRGLKPPKRKDRTRHRV